MLFSLSLSLSLPLQGCRGSTADVSMTSLSQTKQESVVLI